LYYSAYAEKLKVIKACKLAKEYIEQNKWEEATAITAYIREGKFLEQT